MIPEKGPDNKAMLVLGGCRSGKSRFAMKRADQFRRKLLVATMEAGDDPELKERIRRHRLDRGPEWQTVEEPLQLCQVLMAGAESAEVIVVDCLTLWLTNCLKIGLAEEEILEEVDNLAALVGTLTVPVILVANEVGLGIVPDTPLGRRFRDLAGWANQRLAGICSNVYFMAAGLPLQLKGNTG
ncbi:MAG: bifunctional adenosylcobinamide kinase/adenosylcobinamide-phosphate guanylyltransferase [Deltaproteobacteria bacterium]|jgi:adenosylcobinamide kinase/adenosylcobinamide-phosphate guanylyltransferase